MLLKVCGWLCPLNFSRSIDAGFAEKTTKWFWSFIDSGYINFSTLTATKLGRSLRRLGQTLFNPMNCATVAASVISGCRNDNYTSRRRDPKNVKHRHLGQVVRELSLDAV